MRQIHGGGLALALTLAAAGCSDDPACTGAACGSSSTASTTFESDLLGGSTGTRGALDASAESGGAARSGAPTAAPAAPAVGTKGQVAADSSNSAPGAAERAISEADIIQVHGDKLYALSRISGLAVIDVKDPKVLKLLGRYRELPATPFEMYLKDDVALVMFSGWGQYAPAADGSYQWVTTSKLLALDVADAASIKQLDSFDIPGSISDSRVVGDILYIVGRQDGYCWNCVQNKPLTSIVSLRVADPRNVTKIDELDYEDGNSAWGPRSVSVTQNRMYVAGPEYGSNQPENSTIQVIDISDAAGDLAEGTRVKVAGQVTSRWQMDEYQGVLRVVSQPWQWWGTGNALVMPAVQTFKVESSNKITALGRTDIQLPKRESLRSVRFDGPRGYAITAEQTDPLFTLDLSDPAQPRQMGELELPGFITHMEPRGERLLGLGFDRGNKDGSIAVSLFDVKDLSAPKLLSRANFGGTWGSLPEDQDRLHKVFRVLEDAGLILVPFSGWNYDETAKGSCRGFGSYVGGVQLIDFANDTLKARGATPSSGETRRALLVQDSLLSVGDERVEAFDIANRDKPAPVSQVVLSRNTMRALALDNGIVARFGADYAKGQTTVDFVNKSAADDANQRLSEVNLAELALGANSACASGLEVRESFVRGNRLELLYNTWLTRGDGTGASVQGLLILDVSQPDKPSVLSNTQWAEGQESWYPYSGFYNYGYYGNSSAVVRTASTLSLLESSWTYDGVKETQKVRLRVIDVRNPAQVKSSVIALPVSSTTAYAGLVADGEVVMTSHFEQSSSDAARGRFYIDRFNLADPAAPQRIDSINVPGALMSYDGASGRAITSEQTRVKVADVTYEQCYKRFANASWTDPRWNSGSPTIGIAVPRAASGGATPTDAPVVPVEQPKGECVGYVQRLHLVRLQNGVGTLEDSYMLEESEQVFSSSSGNGVLFASLGRGGYYYPAADIACLGPCGHGGVSQPSKLLVLSGFANGKLTTGHITVDDSDQNDRWWGFWGAPVVYGSGTQALLVGQSDVAIIDASDASQPSIRKRVPLIASAQYVDVHPEEALLSLGQQGLQWIDLKP